jgi:PEGA domain-containing protein
MATNNKYFGFPCLSSAIIAVCILGPALVDLPAFSSRAWAQIDDAPPTACVAVGTDKFSEKAAAVLNHLARENLGRAEDFDLVDIRKFLNQGASDPRIDAHAKAIELTKSGKNQYDDLELDGAIDQLNKAIELYQKAAGRLGDGKEYLDALLFLGAAYILSGDNERGTFSFRTVAMFDKRKTIDTKVFPPSMIEIFNQVREEVAASPVGTVQVKSTPPAAEVYLNGVYKGITPLTLVKVPEGTHFVRMEKDGFLPWGQRVDFYATHEETSEASLQPSPQFSTFINKTKPLLGELDEDPPEKGPLAFGAWLKVEKFVAIKVKQRGDEVSAEAVLIQMAPPKMLSRKTASFNLTRSNFLARADAFFSSLYRNVKMPTAEGGGKKGGQLAVAVARCNSDSDCAVGEVCDSASSRCIPYAPEADAFYEKWWFWTIIGGGLAVAGGTAVMVWYLTQPEEGAIEFSF